MRVVLLTDICRPKQWKTISTENLHNEGYPVYGANGVIGYYDSYTHEEPTILITCRGATCGTINVTDPKSYVNGNAMALDKLSKEVDLQFLKYFLEHRGLDDVISGSAQPQITRQNLSKLTIPLPPLATQKKIAEILDAADAHRQKTKQLLAKYDELAQSIFLDMFGDPVTNPKGWEVKKLEEVCEKILGGGTPSKSNEQYYTGTIPWVTPKDMKVKYIDTSIDKITSEAIEQSSAKLVPIKSLLLVIRSGILKKKLPLAINEREVALNQDMKAFVPSKSINVEYFFYLMKSFESFLLSKVRAVTADNIEFKQIKELLLPLPQKELQDKFDTMTRKIKESKLNALEEAGSAENLFNSLLQKAFKGELV